MKLYFLMGMPGSGKTTIIKRLCKDQKLKSVMIDTLYKSIKREDETVEWFNDEKYGENVYKAFLEAILKELQQSDVIIEATGTGNRIHEVLKNVEKEGHSIIKIFLKVNFENAKKRVQERNSTNYEIKISEEEMQFFNKAINELDVGDCFVIDANKEVADILKEINTLI